MCSRYFLDADGNVIAYTFSVPVHERIRKRFNIAPTQEAPVIRAAEGGALEVALLRWGLVPAWAQDLKVGTKMINARSETVAEKPAFKAAFRSRRCLVPATGFFEWQGDRGCKSPYAITVPDRPVFAFAGLWESWRPPEGAPVETFTILTTKPNETIARIHDRMPVILPVAHYGAWLAGTPEEAKALLQPYAGEVALRAIAKTVGNPRIDTPDVLADAAPEGPLKPAARNGELF